MIEWCNNNAGFLTAVGVIATLLGAVATSVVAVLVARWPYRAGLDCNHFLDVESESSQDSWSYTLHLFLCNSGNVPLRIDEISIFDEDHIVYGHCHGEWAQFLAPLELQEITIDFCVPKSRSANEMWIEVKTQRKTFSFKETWAVG